MTIPGNPQAEPIDWRNLVRSGRDLLEPQQVGQAPTVEHARRAISAAYYALFHALADGNASVLITGTADDPATSAAWSRVYRGIESYYLGMKQCCGVEKCQARKAESQRNHICMAIQAPLRVETV